MAKAKWYMNHWYFLDDDGKYRIKYWRVYKAEREYIRWNDDNLNQWHKWWEFKDLPRFILNPIALHGLINTIKELSHGVCDTVDMFNDGITPTELKFILDDVKLDEHLIFSTPLNTNYVSAKDTSSWSRRKNNKLLKEKGYKLVNKYYIKELDTNCSYVLVRDGVGGYGNRVFESSNDDKHTALLRLNAVLFNSEEEAKNTAEDLVDNKGKGHTGVYSWLKPRRYEILSHEVAVPCT